MPRASLTRAVRFSAAHRYYRADWSPEKNKEVFGACSNEFGHGHNYRCSVTVEGQIGSQDSMVVNLSQLDRILREVVYDWLDHQHLNHVVPQFAKGDLIPTAEALATVVWPRIAEALPAGVALKGVRVQEDDDLYADYHGDG